jgi:transposase
VTSHVNRNFESLLQKHLVSVVRESKPPWQTNERGRRPHAPRNVAICCMLMVALGKTYDSIEAYLKVNEYLKALLHTDSLPGHSVIHRGMTRMPLPYIRMVLRKTVWRLRRDGMTVAVDASGMSTTDRSVWFDIRIGRKNSRRECVKLHIVVDVDTGVIHDFEMTPWYRGDSPQFKRLMKELPGIAAALGDKAYSSRENCEIVARMGGKSYLLFKSNATGRAKAHPEWRRSFLEFTEDREGWMAIYHLRSIVEGVFSSLKRSWGSALRSRRYWNRRKELALKVLAYDVRQVLYNERAEELGVDLRVRVS